MATNEKRESSRKVANRSPLDRSHSPQGWKNRRPDLWGRIRSWGRAGAPQGAEADRPFGRGSQAPEEGAPALYTPRRPMLPTIPPHPAEGQDPPCQVQAPQKHHQLQCQVGHEEWVVALPHTVLHPGAVVVVAADTATALTAVSGP